LRSLAEKFIAGPRCGAILQCILLSLYFILPFRSLTAKDEGRALWIVRTTLDSRSSIDRAIRYAKEGGFRILFVQVVGRGDAYYRSSILPRGELLSPGGDFDPLDYFLNRAHENGLEVHAWVNLLYIWSSPRIPNSPLHVFRSHPEWLVKHYSNDGSGGFNPGPYRGGGEGDRFLSPALPAVRNYLTGVVRELIDRYPIDGLHLDYVRYPSGDAGFEDYTRQMFKEAYHVDPVTLFDESADLPSGEEMMAEWYEWRARQVTDLLAAIRRVQLEESPGLTLSVAVIPGIARARKVYGQDWAEWAGRGLVDLVVVMTYSPLRHVVLTQVREARSSIRRGLLFVGMAAYNQPVGRLVSRARELRELGVDGFSFFSYNTLLEDPSNFSFIRNNLFAGPVGVPSSR
jgi:uncharacterized lipoprotein YddW (UPF0748 family)